MTEAELRRTLLLEVHRLIAEAAPRVLEKLGKPIPAEAKPNYLTASDIEWLKANDGGFTNLEHPAAQKWMAASMARTQVLSYPSDGQLTDSDIQALESMVLTDAQRSVLTRLVAEACHAAFFHFFCILDSVGDPELTQHSEWHGARFVYPRKEGPMLHDDLGDAFTDFRKKYAS